MKKCTKCGIEKELTEFHNDKKGKYGKVAKCKSCIKLISEQYYEENKDNYKSYRIENKSKIIQYRCKNQEKIKLTKKLWRNKNKEKVKEQKKLWEDSNKHKKKQYDKKYHEKNKKEMNNKHKLYRMNNKEKIREGKKRYKKEHKYIFVWRSILKSTILRMHQKKSDRTIKLLGYSALELKKYIEELFTIGMTWDNHGEWHIDHIKPVISFNKNTPPSIVNALENLRPLWATTREINGIIYEGNLNREKY